MRFILFFITIWCITGIQCSKNLDIDAPACIERKIKEILSQSKWNPPASVSEYDYKGQKVYLFSSDCCDQYIKLYDSNCNYICAPSGGIAGNGDRKCSDFYSQASFIRLVWKDAR